MVCYSLNPTMDTEKHTNGSLSTAVSSPEPFSTGIKGIWDSRLRSYHGLPMTKSCVNGLTPTRRAQSFTKSTPSTTGESAEVQGNGLTDSPAVRSRSSSLVRVSGYRRLQQSSSVIPHVSTASRRSASQPTSAGEMYTVTNVPQKPLFTNFLLQEIEPHEEAPALTVVLDLDETLVSNRNMSGRQAVLRPYCLHVLNALRHMKSLEIVMWTASTKETALPVVQQLHSSGIIFDDLIFRSKAWFTEPVHTKDIRLLGRDLDRVVLVDNAANCCKLHRRNAILIEDFHGFRDAEDAALVNVYYMIQSLLNMCKAGVPVPEGLDTLVAEGHLCHNIEITLPEAWRKLPLHEIAPVKLPAHGRFVHSHSKPPTHSIMRHWTI